MIISCEKCNKKFELSGNLIPTEGRTLQCGSCLHKWHFIPVDKTQSIQQVKKNEVFEENFTKKTVKEKENLNETNLRDNKKIDKKNKKIGFLSYILIFIITFIALIIIAETFEPLLSSYIPGFDFYLLSLHESLKDIFLFFKDLIK